MRGAICFLLGVFVALILVPRIETATAGTKGHSFLERNNFLNKQLTDQISYVHGVADAIFFLTPDNAVGARLSKCFDEALATAGVIVVTNMLEKRLQANPGADPIPATLLELYKSDCKDYLK